MSTPLVSRPGLAWVLLAALVLLTQPAGAEKYLGAAGGAFVPYAGDVGWTVLLEMGADLPSPHFRLGGEAVFATESRDVNLATFGVGTGSVETTIRVYQLNLVGRYLLFPGRFSPYIGATGGFSVVELDDSDLYAAVGNPAILPSTNGVGFAGGVGGLIGIETPMFSRDLNLFLEGRADYGWEITDNLSPVAGQDDFNGISVVLGLRGRF